MYDLYVAIVMFLMLYEMMSILVIKKLCEFIYVNLLKQLKFCKNKLCRVKYVFSCGIKV